MPDTTPTPAASWRQDGQPDPHADRYDCERSKLAMGHLTDDELANGAFMNYDRRLMPQQMLAGDLPPIAWMTAVKDRIRWLSRALEKAKAERRETRGADSQRQQAEAGSVAAEARGYVREGMTAWDRENLLDCIDKLERAAAPAPVEQAEPAGWRELAQRCLASMRAAVHYGETREGRPPQQTCLFEIQDLEAMLAAAPQPTTSQAAGLPIEQEPKYTVNGTHVVNRASGEPIPHDEPVFIFRARDTTAAASLMYYHAGHLASDNRDHADAVLARIRDFQDFLIKHPERAKYPDTASAKDTAP